MNIKKILLFLTGIVLSVCAGAKTIKITMADGSLRVFASAELESIEFADDGTLIVTTWDGKNIDMGAGTFDVVDIDDEAAVTCIKDMVLTLPLGSEPVVREVKKIDIVYPSVDPQGNPMTLSGVIYVPTDIWDGQVKSDGIVLVNHFTTPQKDMAPTKGGFGLELLYVANPYGRNYIGVVSDFYGFGVTERYPQAFLQGSTNGYASIHMLLAAREMLSKMGVDYGPLLFNVGYSSGGFDAMATQKVRDMEYRDEVWFDKTFAGGGPYDMVECYKDFVKTDVSAFISGIGMTIVATNECQQLGIPYSDLFQKPLDTKFTKWIMDKELHQFAIRDSVERYASRISEVMMPAYTDLNSAETKRLLDVLYTNSLTHDWKPDPTQKIYLVHARDDDYVPFASAHPLLDFLKKAGYENNINAGRTNLQSNFFFKELGHIGIGALFALESLFAVTAWPKVYDENHMMKEEYAERLAQENSSALATMNLMNEVGIDTQWLKNAVMSLRESTNAFIDNPDDEQEGDGKSSDITLLSVLQTYFGLLPENDEEEAAMKEDIGMNPRTYLQRLRRLLIVIGILS